MSGRRNRRPRRGKNGRRNPVIVVLSTAVLIAMYAYFGPFESGGAGTSDGGRNAAVSSESSGAALRDAIRDERSGALVLVTARVVKNLPDDNEGSRHQRFIIGLDEPVGDVRTILIAHNIDLAPKVPCFKGDVVTVSGQYEWNDKGGVIHWTHHDPGGRRAGGWIEHNGERYE